MKNELKQINEKLKNHQKQQKRIKALIGDYIAELWSEEKLKFETENETTEAIFDLLWDLKDWKEWEKEIREKRADLDFEKN